LAAAALTVLPPGLSKAPLARNAGSFSSELRR
jgi:hypothetical protein